jgi:hypothetical protein
MERLSGACCAAAGISLPDLAALDSLWEVVTAPETGGLGPPHEKLHFGISSWNAIDWVLGFPWVSKHTCWRPL